MSLLGTKILSWWKGKLMGVDQFGNRYYAERDGEPGNERRWVQYRGVIEASKVPPEWHGWLHKMTDELPPQTPPRRFWQREHLPNLTGTGHAYRPVGDLQAKGKHAPATGEYQAWRPE